MIERIQIIVTDNGIYRIDGESFDGKILASNDHKIYVTKRDGDFLYVGKTIQTIGQRFRGNFLSHKKHLTKNQKDYSYKWIAEFMNDLTGIDLFVYKLEKKDDKLTEAIEAELVYLIRKETGSWPKFQHEIHFRNISEAQEVACEIFQLLQ